MQIHSATILVSDQAKAVDWYTNMLGWSVSIDYEMAPGQRFITVRPFAGAVELSLGSLDWSEPDFGSIGGQTGVSLMTDQIDRDFEELTARGVRFKGPVESMPWGGRATWFYDLDDNEFFLVGE